MIEAEFNKVYEPRKIYMIFCLIFMCNLIINIDHGAIPACSNEIKKEVQIQNLELGLLGSIVYVGLTFGSMLATGLYSRGRWIKPTIVSSIFLNSLCLYLFTESRVFFIMAFFRATIGFF
jgi:sugar phosphate permease